MKSFFSAIRFFTILPAGRQRDFDAAGMIRHLPLVGLLTGAIVAAFDMSAVFLWNRATASLLDVVLFVILTGGLHLDGLGDSADGLFSHRSREKSLEIMKDSRVGAMGLVAIVLVLAVKCAGIINIETDRWLFLIIVPAYSRGSLFFGVKFLSYGRPGGGLGYDFFSKKIKISSCLALTLPIGLSMLAGFSAAAALNIGFAIMTAGIIIYYKKKMDCVTGDMLGAMVEVMECWLFLTAGMGWGRC